MFGLGLFEILFIAVLGLLLIGPEQLPEVTKALARFLTDIRRSTNALKSDFDAHAGANFLKIEEERTRNERAARDKGESSKTVEGSSETSPVGHESLSSNSSEQMSFEDIKTPAEASKIDKTEGEP